MPEETLQDAAVSYADLRLKIWDMADNVQLRVMLEVAFTRGGEWADEKRQAEFNAIAEEVSNA